MYDLTINKEDGTLSNVTQKLTSKSLNSGSNLIVSPSRTSLMTKPGCSYILVDSYRNWKKQQWKLNLPLDLLKPLFAWLCSNPSSIHCMENVCFEVCAKWFVSEIPDWQTMLVKTGFMFNIYMGIYMLRNKPLGDRRAQCSHQQNWKPDSEAGLSSVQLQHCRKPPAS